MPPLEQIWLRWGATKSVASVKKPKQIKWRFLKNQPTKRKRIEIGRRIIDLSFFRRVFYNGCCKCRQKFELKKNIIKETNLGLCSTFHFICTNCSAISILKSSDTFSKEMNSARRKPYAVNLKAAFGKYALCVYTLCSVCTSYNSYM